MSKRSSKKRPPSVSPLFGLEGLVFASLMGRRRPAPRGPGAAERAGERRRANKERGRE